MKTNAYKISLGIAFYVMVITGNTMAQCPVNEQTVSAAAPSIACSGSTSINVSSSQVGVSYHLINSVTGNVLGAPVEGTGAAISLPTGAIANTTTYNVYGANPSNAVRFNGTNQYMNVPAPVGLPTGNVITVEAWVFPISYPDATYSGIVSYGPRNCSPSGKSFLLSMTSAGRPSMATWCNDFVPNTGPTANLNQWNHIACVLNGTSVKLYLNGFEWSGTLGLMPSIVSGPMNIGCTDNPGRYMNAKIDEVRIWNTARTADQINQNKLTCLTGTEPGLVTYYKFEEGAGTTVADIAGSNTGNLINAPLWQTGSSACSPCFLTLSQSATVTIVDNAATVATSPGNFSVNVAPGTCSAVVTYTNPTFDDDCDGTGLSGVLTSGGGTASGQTFPVGPTTVSFTFTDSKSNVTTENFTITVVDNEAPAVSNCSGNISVNASTSGCTANVSWVDPTGTDNCSGAITPSSTHISGDNFSVGITNVSFTFDDGNGNTATCAFNVEVINDLLGSSVENMVSCNGGSDGSIDITATGGTGTYTYLWDDGAGFTSNSEDLTGIPAGSYTVTATDGNGCEVGGTIVITEPTPVDVQIDFTSDPTACATADGTAMITASGGTESGTYDYAWSDGGSYSSIVEDPSDIPAGLITVIVTDDNGCTGMNSFSLSDPNGPSIAVNSSSVLALLCNGDSNGDIQIDVTLNGGATSATYDWDNDATGDFDDTEDLSGVTANNYNVVVLDNNNCSSTISVTITEPSAILASGVTTDETFGNDGTIDLTVSGGTPGYTFSWTGPNGFTASSEDLSGLAAGVYDVTITDASGCTTTEQVNVNSQVGIENENLNFSIYPNPTTGLFVIALTQPTSIQIYDASGREVFQSFVISTKTEIDLSSLNRGVYYIKLVSDSRIDNVTIVLN